MAKKDNNSDEKIADLENKNAQLQDKVESLSDPKGKPIIVRRGYVNKQLKFQKNNIRINACTGVRTDPSKPIPAK